MDLLERLLPEHRVRRTDSPMSGWAFLALVVPLVLGLGLVCGAVLVFSAGDALQRAVFAAEGVPVRATALETADGRVKVEFTTPTGNSVVTWADGEYRPHPEHAVTVLHLADDPALAQVADHEPGFGGALALLLLAFPAVLFSLHHRSGLRAGWFVRRFRVHVQGPARRPRRLVPLAAAAVVLTVLAAVPVVAVLSVDRTELLVEEAHRLLLPVPVLLFCALVALIRVVHRYAEDRPVGRFPRPFRLLPVGSARALLVLFTAAALVAVAWSEYPEPMADPVPGTAEVLDAGSRGSGFRLDIRYEVDGLTHYRSVGAGRALGEGLLEDDTVGVVWDADDPGNVRLR
ncbi:hypothetical protein SUDANB121_02463 [Nocardiopsis dassonvillei]